MVTPVLKGIDMIENQYGLKGTAYIAEEDDMGSDCFHFQVLTPELVLNSLRENKILSGRGIFIVQDYSEELLVSEINKILQDCIRPTWDEAAIAINRYLNWEYDNIHYFTEREISSSFEI
ncbi:Imm8 family immunity protein [Paenibacillus sp. FSL P2-0089]|uniref:Imm8 family immunity protein n=1 Tax=Paenibacillus sp. FSL P2-0089 TaxID=2954526 RepID=UPI00315B12CB